MFLTDMLIHSNLLIVVRPMLVDIGLYRGAEKPHYYDLINSNVLKYNLKTTHAHTHSKV